MSARHEYVNELVDQIAPEVWRGLAGNGSIRIGIDTDVDCYGPFESHGPITGEDSSADRVQEAQDWVEYFVRSVVNRLIDLDLLNAPED